MTWSSNHDASVEKMRQVQGSLTVALIMTSRADFMTCTPSETAAEVKRRNVSDFSFLPVVDDAGKVIGLYDAERWFGQAAPDAPIGADFLPMTEEIVIAADASIFDFILQADRNSTNLVVSGSGIAGLVSLSDLQRLPVRSALFALLTSFEMAMARAIECRWQEPAGWMAFLSDNRRGKLEAEIAKAKEKDGFISEIAFTQLADKATILLKGRLLSAPRKKTEKRLNEINGLRDAVAHANSFAETPAKAKGVCEIVRSIYELKKEVLDLTDSQVSEI